MKLYGIREISDGQASTLCVLAQSRLSGELKGSLDSNIYLEVESAITLVTGRKTVFASPDLKFVSELFDTGQAVDFKEYFEFERIMHSNVRYEIFDFATGEVVEPVQFE